MKSCAIVMLMLVGVAGAYAQRGGGHRGGGMPGGGHAGGGHPGIVAGHSRISVPLTVSPTIPFRTFGSPTGFGNVLFPGTGSAPPLTDPFNFPFTFPHRLSPAFKPGFRHHGSRFGFGGPVVVPFPVYVGDPYGYGYEQPQPQVIVVAPPQQPAQAAPPVTIQQYFGESAQPVTREYGPNGEETIRTYQAPTPNRPEREEDDSIQFMIALKDGSIYTAAAYWVEGEILHYITTQGRHNQVSLDLVDRETSLKLNRGRQVEFRLPPAVK